MNKKFFWKIFLFFLLIGVIIGAVFSVQWIIDSKKEEKSENKPNPENPPPPNPPQPQKDKENWWLGDEEIEHACLLRN